MNASPSRGERGRHPSARSSGGNLAQPARRVAEVLPNVVGPHRGVAVAAVAVRGQQGRSRAEFAWAYGVSEQQVEQVEHGEVSPASLPAPLRLLTPIEPLAAVLDASPAPVVPARQQRGAAGTVRRIVVE